MSHYNIKMWEEFRSYLSENKNSIDRKQLLDQLKALSERFKQAKDVNTQGLYEDYLAYFEAINFSSYYICKDPWYSLDNLIQYDILNPQIDNYKLPIIHLRDLLWELLVFRSERECPTCGMDMRVLSPKSSDDLHFDCDNCATTIDLEGNPIVVEEIHYPALYDLIKAAGIEPCIP